MVCEYGPAGCKMSVNAVSDGGVNQPKGVRGGADGGASRQLRKRADGTLEELPVVISVEIDPAERIVSYTCGGGGYGEPKRRSPAQVAYDVREGLVSRERARSVYGVALTADGRVDEKETARLREAA